MSTTTKQLRTAKFYGTMTTLGFTFDETETLRRAQLTLHRWDEAGANGDIQRDEDTGKPYRYYGRGRAKSPCIDRETAALVRIDKALAARNARHKPKDQLLRYHQCDCRGCALYVIHQNQIKSGENIDSVYNRGFAVCI